MTIKYDELLSLNGNKLNKKYIQSLSKQERLDIINPIFDILRNTGWIYPDNDKKLHVSYKRLLEYVPDLTKDDQFNNSSLATDICKYFCHSFYATTEKAKPTLFDNFNNDDILKRIIKNRLGLDWLETDNNGPGVNEAFNLSFKMIVIQGQRSMRLVNATSMFKPSIAKYMALKYSLPNDIIFDYSCGFGGRMLGTVLAGRKYIGTDPLTVPELTKMVQFFDIQKHCTLIDSGSEDYCGEENSIDLCWSSPPYVGKTIQEYYSADISQAYNKGEDYFYNTYWKKTLENAKYMLKPNKWFGLNILDKYTKMIDMAKATFGNPVETVKLRTVKSHLTKNANLEDQKYEPIYMFKNVK